jgi:signal transduction histidine kinase
MSNPDHDIEAKPEILVVDDQADMLNVIHSLLEADGLSCRTCTRGTQVFDILANHSIDVVLLDVVMPDLDGYQVCRRIKSDPNTRDIPVLFLTARFDPEGKAAGLKLGGHDYISKPVDPQELLARTRAALRVKRLQDELKNRLTAQEQLNQLQQHMIGAHWEKTLGQLAASLAHEINNPLAAALGNVQILTMDPQLNQEARRRLQVMEENIKVAARKLKSLLLISDTRRSQQWLGLTDVVRQVVTLANFQALNLHVSIRTEFDETGTQQVTAHELARAILYLLNNAIEAAGRSNHGEGTVWITTDQDETALYVRVTDNGPGIPEACQRHVFEPFVTMKGPPHNGLGLYLAQQAVHRIGGKLRLDSPAEKGATRMSIILPHE